LIFEQIDIILASARTVLSNGDFGVEQFFRADEFRAVDLSPFCTTEQKNETLLFLKECSFNRNVCYFGAKMSF
jgi:hypothetical protein